MVWPRKDGCCAMDAALQLPVVGQFPCRNAILDLRCATPVYQDRATGTLRPSLLHYYLVLRTLHCLPFQCLAYLPTFVKTQ